MTASATRSDSFCDFGISGFWDFRILGFWDFGILGFWDFGILGFFFEIYVSDGSLHTFVDEKSENVGFNEIPTQNGRGFRSRKLVSRWGALSLRLRKL